MKSTTALEHQNESSTLHSHGDNVAKAIIVQVVPDEQSPLLQKSSSDSKSLSTSQHQHYQTNSTSNNNKSETKPRAVGLGLIAIAAVIFSYMNVLIKFCGAGFPSFQILLIRSIIQSLCGFLSCTYLGVNPFGPRPVRFWLVLRGLAGGSAVAASYYALTHLPFSDASVILYLNAALTTLLAAIFLGEPFHLFQGVCVALCFVGSVLVTKPEFIFGSVANHSNDDHHNENTNRGFAVLVAFFAAFVIALSFCIVRKIGKSVHFLVHTSYYGVISTLICIPPLLTVQSFVWPQFASEYFMLSLSGVLAFVGQCFLSKGFQITPAGSAAIINMNGLVLSFINGIFIFGERPDWLNILGAVIIAVTTAMLAMRK